MESEIDTSSDIPEMVTLEEKSIVRITIDMILSTIEKAKGTFVILIIDDYVAKLLSSFMTMSDLLNLGVFSVEKLKIKRKPYPSFHALYFISPTTQSCQYIINDFGKKPLYARAHIFFTEKIEDEIFDILVNENLVKRTVTCKELNFSFYIRGKNIFDLGEINNLGIFSGLINKADKTKFIQRTAEKLLTVCSVLQEYPNIQYQKNSKICAKISELLNSELKKLYKHSKNKKGILLITDRTLDPTSPLLHDYNYKTMVYDMFKIKNKNEITFGKFKNIKLDDKDELWTVYKDKHLVEVFNQLSDDFDQFMKSDLSKVDNYKQIESFNQMEDCMRNITGYKLKNTLFSIHVKLGEEVNSKFKTMNMDSIIEMEQDILTGINEEGEKISNKNIIEKFKILKTKLERNSQQKEILRILAIMYTCLDLNEKEFNQLLEGSFDDIHSRNLFDNFQYLGVELSDGMMLNNQRKYTMSRESLKNVQQKLSKIKYKALRAGPKIENIVENCTKLQLNKNSFSFIEEPSNLKVEKKYGTKGVFGRKKINNNDEDKPVLIYFNVGGISHNEIAVLNNLVNDDKINYRLIIGSTGIYNAQEYLDDLTNMNSFMDSSMESEMLEISKGDNENNFNNNNQDSSNAKLNIEMTDENQ